jgi:hypothetical protein
MPFSPTKSTNTSPAVALYGHSPEGWELAEGRLTKDETIGRLNDSEIGLSFVCALKMSNRE